METVQLLQPDPVLHFNNRCLTFGVGLVGFKHGGAHLQQVLQELIMNSSSHAAMTLWLGFIAQ